jgi:hypothetical protein
MKYHMSLAVLLIVATLLALMVWGTLRPHQMRLLLGGGEVEIIMTCREPLLMGDGLCVPEGHTYHGVYEAWVE